MLRNLLYSLQDKVTDKSAPSDGFINLQAICFNMAADDANKNTLQLLNLIADMNQGTLAEAVLGIIPSGPKSSQLITSYAWGDKQKLTFSITGTVASKVAIIDQLCK